MGSDLPPKRIGGINRQAERSIQDRMEALGGERWQQGSLWAQNALDATGRIEIRVEPLRQYTPSVVYARGFWVAAAGQPVGYLLERVQGELKFSDDHYALIGGYYAVGQVSTGAGPWHDVVTLKNGRLYLNANVDPKLNYSGLAPGLPHLTATRVAINPDRYQYITDPAQPLLRLLTQQNTGDVSAALTGAGRATTYAHSVASLGTQPVTGPLNYVTYSLVYDRYSDHSSAGFRLTADSFEVSGSTLTVDEFTEEVVGASGRSATFAFTDITPFVRRTETDWTDLFSPAVLLPKAPTTSTNEYQLPSDLDYMPAYVDCRPTYAITGTFTFNGQPCVRLRVRYDPAAGSGVVMHNRTLSPGGTQTVTHSDNTVEVNPETVTLAQVHDTQVRLEHAYSATYTSESTAGSGLLYQYTSDTTILEALEPAFIPAGGIVNNADGNNYYPYLQPWTLYGASAPNESPTLLTNYNDALRRYQEPDQLTWNGSSSETKWSSTSGGTTKLLGLMDPEAVYVRFEATYDKRWKSGDYYSYSVDPITWQNIWNHYGYQNTFGSTTYEILAKDEAALRAVIDQTVVYAGIHNVNRTPIHVPYSNVTKRTARGELTVRSRDYVYYDGREDITISLCTELIVSNIGQVINPERNYRVWYEVKIRGLCLTEEVYNGGNFAPVIDFEDWVLQYPVGTTPTFDNNIAYVADPGGVAVFAPRYCEQGLCPFIAYTTLAEEAAGARPEFFLDMPMAPTTYFGYENPTGEPETSVQFVPHQMLRTFRKYLGGQDEFGFLTRNQNLIAEIFAIPVRLQVCGTSKGAWAGAVHPTLATGTIHLGRT